MTAPRFYFITNDLPRAALEFSCHPGNLPHWLAVLDNVDAWMRIPDGSKCMGLWYGSAADLEGWRNVWNTREARGGIDRISVEELDRILAWAETARAAPSNALLYGAEPIPPSRGDALRPPALKSTSLICPDAPVASEPTRGEVDPAAPSLPAIQQSQPRRRVSKWT